MLNKKQRKMLARILIAAAFAAGIRIADPVIPNWVVRFLLYLIPYLIAGYDVLKKAFHGIRNRQPFDECFLMAVATVGAFGVSIYESMTGAGSNFLEAVAVMVLYQTGELFQSVAVGKSRKNISELMDIRPDYANIEQADGSLEKVDPDEVEIGTVIVVQPGEKIPIDGVVVEGTSMLNTAALTGESVPRSAFPDTEVLSGCINESGLLKIRTMAEFGDSTASKILDLVENAASRKSRSENFISKFAKVYTPIVCYAALALAVISPVVGAAMGRDPMIWQWIYRACSFLVISCPCAIVISIPLSFFGGLGGASSQGILIKGSNYMETLSKVRTVAFDKTGTITRGSFEVSGIHHSTMEEKKLLEYAALVECRSTHPISQSLRRAYGLEFDPERVTDLHEISGRGVIGMVDGVRIAAGNEKLMQQLGIEAIPCHSTGTIVHMAVDGKYAGHIVISDEIKPESKAAIEALHHAGISRTVMLTGDSEKVAKNVASAVGIDEYHAGLLPGDKVQVVEQILTSSIGGKLAFVGDGINDAPVLSRADVGIAMGAMGSDAAIEAADVVLMDDDPRKIAKAIRIARRCMRIVYENIVFAISVKLLCLGLSALGLVGMWVAIFADVGVMILCVLNALRVLFTRNV